MSNEQLLLERWRSLPIDRQKEVLTFIEFLSFYTKSQKPAENTLVLSEQPSVGERLQMIRDKIVASGVPLLNPEEVEREKAERRGESQGENR